jgi:hypothetical protein
MSLPFLASAQYPFPAPTTPDAQRNALNQVRSQVNYLQNATRTAANYGQQGYGNVWERFQIVRGAYGAFKQTLNPRQAADGANAFAELDGGLDILQEAFDNYQTDIAAGRPAGAALRDMCQVLRDGSRLWLDELNKTCSRLRVGW